MHPHDPACRLRASLPAAAVLFFFLSACSKEYSTVQAPGPGGGGAPGTDDGTDSDADGLTDFVETNGWEIAVDADGFGTDHLSTRSVASNRLVPDTDGDGLDDYEEYVLRSDPQRADSDGDDLDDLEEWTRWYTNPVSVDSDGDARGPGGSATPNPALFDGLELSILKTSPSLADTDGDGRTDFEERDDPVRSPLVAEIPDFRVTFEGETTVRLNVEYEESIGQTTEYGTTLTQSTTHTEESSHTAIVMGHVNVTIGGEYKFGGTDAGATIKGEVEGGIEWGNEDTTSFTDQSESGAEYSRMQSDSLTRTESASSGFISQGLRIENTGSTTFELETLALTVLQWVPSLSTGTEGNFRAVSTLLPAVSGLTLAPGERTDVIQVDATDVNASLLKEFLAQPTTLHYSTGTVELVDSHGINFDFLTQNTFSRTADVFIDFGGEQVERHRVATNVQRGPGGVYEGISMREVMQDVLRIPYTTTESSATPGEMVLASVREADAAPGNGFGFLPRAAWTILTATDEQAAAGRSFDDIVLRGGEFILLVYTRDEDQDGLFRDEESLFGTSDTTLHSDADADHPEGDGLDDYFEIHTGWTVGPIVDPDLLPTQTTYEVRSDPNLLDADGDGLSDDVELAHATDPRKADTDGDGLSDAVEIENGLPPLTRAPRLYVDQSQGSPAGPGTSWPGSYSELRDALADASLRRTSPDPGDDVSEIWVAAGTYLPVGNGDIESSFRLLPLLSVYGGFVGDETKRDQRDSNPVFNDCVLSGAVGGNHSWHVVVADSAAIDSSAVLDGFQITEGTANSEASGDGHRGGGLFVSNGASPVFRNLFFRLNYAVAGGGAAWISGGRTSFEDCIFDQNRSGSISARGGALHVENGDCTLTGCRFTDNSTGGRGGALSSRQLGSGLVVARGCLFLRNTANDPPLSGTLVPGGCGAYLVGGTHRFENCRFLQNGVSDGPYYGGGIFNSQSDVSVVQCVFWKNLASAGGAIGAFRVASEGLPSFRSTETRIVNSTFHANDTGALHFTGGVNHVSIQNSILWDNSPGDTEQGEIYAQNANVDVLTSCIQYLSTYAGFGNIASNPLFISPDGGNLRLQSGSLCIDAGNDLVDFDPQTPGFQAPPQDDLDGNARSVDGNDDAEAVIDMGAYEVQS